MGNVKLLKDGPIMVSEAKLVKEDGTEEEVKNIYLCRCGGSKNKPYCDGTHRLIEFKSTKES